MGVNFQGMDELIRRLNTLGNRAESVKEEALMKGAEHLRQDIENRAPKGPGNKHIKDNIITEKKGDSVLIGPQKDYFYGHFLEFGTKKMSARPFMGPAFQSNMTAIQNKMADVIKRELNL